MHSDLIQSLIGDFALILMLAAIAAIVFKLLKQPLVLGYIVAGFIASPHFKFLPTVANPANISFWAQLGIVVLLFSLGLEFSFQKLVKVGGTALLTCLIIVVGMMGVGFVVGGMLGYSTIDAIFLGGMISMSSTTIIIKALSDLNLKHRSFVPRVMAVLIVEDLVAVVLLVILSSIAINKRVEGDQMLEAVLKLSFYLIIWFTVGIFVIPSLLKKFRRFIGDELLLIIAMGLCFGMATLAVWSGFSLALGAFVIGSILAGTTEAERIERIITPVKDLFGAVFFISVGMMVDPVLMWHNAGIILLLAVVVVVGMITFGTFGMVVTGQPLKTAMESGFCLTQIGEFSFIIATTGTQLGVLGKNIYPIIVAVSVITTFFTPFFIKQALPCYNWVARHLPEKWGVLLEGYSKNAAHSEMSQSRQLWHKVVRRYLITLVVYTVVVIALWFPIRHIVMPLIYEAIPGHWGRLLAALCGFGLVSPFLYGIIVPRTKAQERAQLVSESAPRGDVGRQFSGHLVDYVLLFQGHALDAQLGRGRHGLVPAAHLGVLAAAAQAHQPGRATLSRQHERAREPPHGQEQRAGERLSQLPLCGPDAGRGPPARALRRECGQCAAQRHVLSRARRRHAHFSWRHAWCDRHRRENTAHAARGGGS